MSEHRAQGQVEGSGDGGRPMAAFWAFWVLACALSWTAMWLATGWRHASGAPALDSFEALLANPLRLTVKFGPTIAGLAILAAGGPALRAAFVAALKRVSAHGLVLALVAPGIATVGALALAGAQNGLSSDALAAGFSFAAAGYWIALRTLLGGGLGEEIGLRGVALPLLLRRMGPRAASVLLGLCWALWHLPALWGRPPVLWAAQAVLTISVSLILTFAWVRFGPSLLPPILFHGAVNGWSDYAETWVPRLGGEAWEAYRLGALALIALALLPLRWRRTSMTETVS